MPIIKSAKKRVRTASKASARNSKLKRSLKNASKTYQKKQTLKSYSDLFSQIDKAVKKGVIHKNKAARLKKRAASSGRDGGLKLTQKPAASVKKTVTKKPAAKKK